MGKKVMDYNCADTVLAMKGCHIVEIKLAYRGLSAKTNIRSDKNDAECYSTLPKFYWTSSKCFSLVQTLSHLSHVFMVNLGASLMKSTAFTPVACCKSFCWDVADTLPADGSVTVS